MTTLLRPLDSERQQAVAILVVARWVLIATGTVVLFLRPEASAGDRAGISVVLAAAAGLNVWLHWWLRAGRPMPLLLPLGAGLLDLIVVTIAMAVIDGFDNPNFLFYFPAVLALTLVFPGWRSAGVVGAVLLAYVLISVFTYDAFDGGSRVDVKDLMLRVVTIAATVVMANMVVTIERARRIRAVARERAAAVERDRVAEEIHDGIAQNLYILSMNLEALRDQTAPPDPRRL